MQRHKALLRLLFTSYNVHFVRTDSNKPRLGKQHWTEPVSAKKRVARCGKPLPRETTPKLNHKTVQQDCTAKPLQGCTTKPQGGTAPQGHHETIRRGRTTRLHLHIAWQGAPRYRTTGPRGETAPQNCMTEVRHSTAPQTVRQDCTAILRGKTVRRNCAARLRSKTAQQNCAARLYGGTA